MMWNTFYSSLPSQFYSIGNNEFGMTNLEVTSLMDTRMHDNGFFFHPPRSLLSADNNWLKGGDHLDFPDHHILDLQPGYDYMTSTSNDEVPILPPLDAISKTRQLPLEAEDQLISEEGSVEPPVSSDWKKNKRRRAEHCSSQCHQQLKDCSAGIPQCRVPLPIQRSQKIGDKITALQKLVSPYGKTDTASVLQEAFLYIKLLQEQIKNLFQMMNNSNANISEGKTISAHACVGTCVDGEREDLHSRGLYLVPISSIREAEADNHVNAVATYHPRPG